jgi:hypothetical protein
MTEVGQGTTGCSALTQEALPTAPVSEEEAQTSKPKPGPLAHFLGSNFSYYLPCSPRGREQTVWLHLFHSPAQSN